MVTLALLTLFGLRLAPQVQEDLDVALDKAANLKNYTAVISMKLEGLDPSGKGPIPIRIQVQPTLPWHYSGGTFEAYRFGPIAALKEPKGGWKKVDASETSKAGNGKRKNTRHFATMMLRYLRTPHELLGTLGKQVKELVKLESVNGLRVYRVTLTPEAAKELGSTGIESARRAGSDEKPRLEYAGTVTFWVTADHMITKYEICTEAKGHFGDREVNGRRTQTVDFSEIGSTKYEVPSDAKKVLEE